jgi:glycine/D-amino acid oxidase-like deaminating enzyme
MRSSYDVIIVGGAVVGASTAHFLKAEERFPGSVLVLERDPTYAVASTALSASGIRTQFSNALNVQISQFGLEVIRGAQDRLGAPIHFTEWGYLFLAATETAGGHPPAQPRGAARLGADVALLTPRRDRRPLPVHGGDDLRFGSLGLSGEGWFDNMGLLAAFRASAKNAGAEFAHAEAAAYLREGDRITGVRLTTGERSPAAPSSTPPAPARRRFSPPPGSTTSPWSPASAPLRLRRGRPAAGPMPLTITPSGTFCRPEGRFFLCGISPEDDPEVAVDDFEPRHDEWEDTVWPAVAALSPRFEAAKLQRFWAGHYDFCTLDHNVIVGPHSEVGNLLLANGFSGHGLQQSPPWAGPRRVDRARPLPQPRPLAPRPRARRPGRTLSRGGRRLIPPIA